MPPAIAVYPTGTVPFAAPIPVPVYPQSPGAPFEPRNYVPPEPSAAPFDARNYVPPDAQHSTPWNSTYEPRTSESAFDNAMQLHGAGITPPVVPPADYLLSPQQSSSSGTSFPQSPSGLSRSTSTRGTEGEVWLYDRPGTWRPRFQMPRSGVSSFLPSLTRGRSFLPGASYDRLFNERHPTEHFFYFISRHHIADFGRPHSLHRTAGAASAVGSAGRRFTSIVPRVEASCYGLRLYALCDGAAHTIYEAVPLPPTLVHRSHNLQRSGRHAS